MIDKSSEEWRKQCEARWVLGLASKQLRQDFFVLVEKARGMDARKELEAAVMVEWNAKKARQI